VRGHLEAVASGPAIVRYICEQIAAGRDSLLKCETTFTARGVAEAANKGDTLAQEAFTRAGAFIGQATADFLHIFNPSIVIFGGGVSRSGDLIMGPIKESMRKNIMDPSYLDGLEIANARLGDDAGLLGSLAQAHVRLSKL
jgi:glucokinase